MTSSILYTVFFIQFSCVMGVFLLFRKYISWRINVLISSVFVTVPIACYEPMGDVGVLFLFDIVILLFLVEKLFLGNYRIGNSSGKLAILIFILPLIYAPIGYFFVDYNFLPFHSIELGTILFRSFIIVLAMSLLESELTKGSMLVIIRLFVVQMLVLFALGALQYLAGVDFVIYERIHDTENQIALLLSQEHKIFLGFGFLGLFRGAVPQMAVLGMFWCTLLAIFPRAKLRDKYAIDLLFLLSMVCVISSMSRAGVIALFASMLLALTFYARFRISILLYGIMVVLLMFAYNLDSILGDVLNILSERFNSDEFSSSGGTAGARVISALAFYHNIQVDWKTWIVGVGGFNPLATHEYYGLYGMHGDYLEILNRYGVLMGVLYLIVLGAGSVFFLKDIFSKRGYNRALSRAFSVLVVGIMLLALSQGALIFGGSAGYLACAQTWLAIIFIVRARKFYNSKNVVSRNDFNRSKYAT